MKYSSAFGTFMFGNTFSLQVSIQRVSCKVNTHHNHRMKYILFLITITWAFSCTKKTPKKTMDTPVIVGSDVDSHGCKASAGYTWSVVKNDCIRLWENGIQLSPIDNKEPNTSVATVIINDDKTKVELFIVGEKESILLDKNAEQNFSRNGYVLIQENTKWLLKKGNNAIYKE